MNRFMHPDLLLEIIRQEQADLRAYYDVSSQLKNINDQSRDPKIRMWLAISDFLDRIRRWIKIRSFGTSYRDIGDDVVTCELNPCS